MPHRASSIRRHLRSTFATENWIPARSTRAKTLRSLSKTAPNVSCLLYLVIFSPRPIQNLMLTSDKQNKYYRKKIPHCCCTSHHHHCKSSSFIFEWLPFKKKRPNKSVQLFNHAKAFPNNLLSPFSKITKTQGCCILPFSSLYIFCYHHI